MTDLYKENILQHYKNPKNFGSLKKPTFTGSLNNPLCGDTLILDIMVEQGKVSDIKFRGEGCAISVASSSILFDYLKGKSLKQIDKLSKPFMEKLINVKISVGRVKCLMLPVNAILKILEKKL
ncbi:MAG: SUF system NifU family Fe-S cluster assembly protein [Patescibacteria group bacterium]